MRVVALYDVHGNVPALHATLAELEVVKPDLIVIGGDIISGPMPVQTLEMLFQLDTPVQFIRGNGDREVVLTFDGEALALEMCYSATPFPPMMKIFSLPLHRMQSLPLTLRGHSNERSSVAIHMSNLNVILAICVFSMLGVWACRLQTNQGHTGYFLMVTAMSIALHPMTT